MSDSVKLQDELVDAVAAPADPGRRKFLGSAATLAAAAVGAPAFLAACDSNPVSAREDERATTGDARLSLGGGKDPGVTLHLMIANTLGAASDVKIPALEKGYNTTYLQRVIVDSDRTGTGLATVLKKLYTFPDKSTAQVLVQDSRGRAWPGRNIYKRTDLVYAMKDALATNPLTYGVWKKSLNAGSAVVAITRSHVVQFQDSVASDVWGNHNDLISRGLCDVFNTGVSGYPLASTIMQTGRTC